MPGLRAALVGLPKHSAFSSEQAAVYWVDISRRILEAFGWLGASLNSEEYQCTKSWRELLVAVSSLELLEWRTDFRGFVGRLERTAASQKFKPETLNAPVQIMDAAEAEGSVFDALWIGSCSDDLWPDSPKVLAADSNCVVESRRAWQWWEHRRQRRVSRASQRGSCTRRRGFAESGAAHRGRTRAALESSLRALLRLQVRSSK